MRANVGRNQIQVKGPLGSYYMCDSMGHMIRDYSQDNAPNQQRLTYNNGREQEQPRQQSLGRRSLPPIRLHTITHKEAQAAQNVIVGTILIFKRLVHALFDVDTSHSFISTTYIKLFELVMGLLKELIYVATPIRIPQLLIKYVSCVS